MSGTFGSRDNKDIISVLLVEDEPQMSDFIVRGLNQINYSVTVAPDGEKAIHLAATEAFELFILDVRVPKIDGFSLCATLRDKGIKAPILFLTALDGADDIVNGFSYGADDYLSKPFEFRVLAARLHALLRRAGRSKPQTLQIADLVVDTLSRTVTRGGKVVPLTAKEYDLIELFMLHKNEVLDRNAIAELVWHNEFDPFTNTIDVYISRLRQKLDSGTSFKLLQTRRGQGYVLSDEKV